MSSHLEVKDTSLRGLKLIQRKPIADSRGYFERLFCVDELKSIINGKGIAQINHTMTVNRGIVRGMHFQHPPHAETKFVSCLRGEVFDVAVDLRMSSPTFLQWHSEILSANNHKTFLIPEGFAHGFQTLTEDCEMLYCHTASYNPSAEGGLNAQDPRLAIEWPLPIKEQSPRDLAHAYLAEDFTGVAL